MVSVPSLDKGVKKVLNKSSAHGSFLKNRAAPHNLTRSLSQNFCSNSNGKSGAKIRLRLAGTIVRRCHRIPDLEVCMNGKRIMLHHGVGKVNNLPNTLLR